MTHKTLAHLTADERLAVWNIATLAAYEAMYGSVPHALVLAVVRKLGEQAQNRFLSADQRIKLARATALLWLAEQQTRAHSTSTQHGNATPQSGDVSNNADTAPRGQADSK